MRDIALSDDGLWRCRPSTTSQDISIFRNRIDVTCLITCLSFSLMLIGPNCTFEAFYFQYVWSWIISPVLCDSTTNSQMIWWTPNHKCSIDIPQISCQVYHSRHASTVWASWKLYLFVCSATCTAWIPARQRKKVNHELEAPWTTLQLAADGRNEHTGLRSAVWCSNRAHGGEHQKYRWMNLLS